MASTFNTNPLFNYTSLLNEHLPSIISTYIQVSYIQQQNYQMNWTSGLLLVFFCALASSSYVVPTGCTPFGVRLALGRNYFAASEKEMVSIRFNTRLACQKSYVTLEQGSSIRKVYCEGRKISYSNYTSYCHKCSIQFVQKGEAYEYMAYGWSGQSSQPAIPFAVSNLKSHLVGDQQNIKMLALGDWGYLQLKAGIYDRLDNAFDYLLKMEDQPDVVYLAGDYAYDLSTNYGVSYESFLIMLSQISTVWPCIFMTGNHEYYTDNDFMLFNSSFELYNLTNENATALDLGSFTFVMADPYGILFENATKPELLTKFKGYLDSASKTKPIVVTTHYPLACSGSSVHCKNERFDLKQFFEMMVDYDTVFYIGAHYHTYERIYPYVKGGDFKLVAGPYSLTRTTKYLVSIVEGIAGNDKSIVETYGKLSPFTAALSYNVTGYGIMKVDEKMLTYDHFKSTDWRQPVDSVKIYFDQMFRKSKFNLREE